MRKRIRDLEKKGDKNELTEIEDKRRMQLKVNLSAIVLLQDKITGKTVEHRRILKSGGRGGTKGASKNQADYN